MLLPKANKTNFVKLLREKGFSVPSIQQAQLTKSGHTFFLRWTDPDRVSHTAYYTGAGGRPVLQVDKQWFDLTMVEVIHFGLVEEK